MNDDKENFDKKKFLDIKKSSNELAEFATEEALRLTDVIHNQETNIKDLNDEKILFERNKIQIDIQKNQQLLINEYKENLLNCHLLKKLDKVKKDNALLTAYLSYCNNGVNMDKLEIGSEIISLGKSYNEGLLHEDISNYQNIFFK